MQLITKESDYAIRALTYLAENKKEYSTAKIISAASDIPYQFLRRILKKLKDKGYTATKEGVGGGVMLIVKPAGIKIADIIEVFQGRIRFSACMARKNICSNIKSCVLREKMIGVE